LRHLTRNPVGSGILNGNGKLKFVLVSSENAGRVRAPGHVFFRILGQLLGRIPDAPFPVTIKLRADKVNEAPPLAKLRMFTRVDVEGWQNVRRLHGCLVHVEIKGDQIWVQQDGTEDGVVTDLLAAGIPKDRIVLGFKSPQSRALTQFAVA